jgi:hypothetical protein
MFLSKIIQKLPAAMKLAAPKSTPGLYIPMVLVIKFYLNITIVTSLYLAIIKIL